MTLFPFKLSLETPFYGMEFCHMIGRIGAIYSTEDISRHRESVSNKGKR